MSADNYFSISPGIIIALWRILSLTARYEQLSVKSVVEITQNSGLFGGKVPAKNALKFGQIYNFIEIQSGSIYLTEHCKEEFIDLSRPHPLTASAPPPPPAGSPRRSPARPGPPAPLRRRRSPPPGPPAPRWPA